MWFVSCYIIYNDIKQYMYILLHTSRYLSFESLITHFKQFYLYFVMCIRIIKQLFFFKKPDRHTLCSKIGSLFCRAPYKKKKIHPKNLNYLIWTVVYVFQYIYTYLLHPKHYTFRFNILNFNIDISFIFNKNLFTHIAMMIIIIL